MDGLGMYVYVGGANTLNIAPNQLPKSHACWANYYAALDAIQAASNINIQALRVGDPNSNPYYIGENEGDIGKPTPCTEEDVISVYTNKNADIDFDFWQSIPFYSAE